VPFPVALEEVHAEISTILPELPLDATHITVFSPRLETWLKDVTEKLHTRAILLANTGDRERAKHILVREIALNVVFLKVCPQ
jgi:hypothetical protein